MGSLSRIGLVALLALSPLSGCDDEPSTGNIEDGLADEEGFDDERGSDADKPTAGGTTHADAGPPPVPSTGSGGAAPSPAPAPRVSPRTEVPVELVGAWSHGYIDFALWDNYRQGQWAGRNAVPSREAMILGRNGDAKFYRYEFAFTLYEELIDCEGTVAFHGDGTFTFYPTKGRKRFFDMTHSERNTDRALTAAELMLPKLAGTRAYAYVPGSSPATVQIKVPSSAAYNWYKQE